MIQINLLPDVKLQYLRAQRNKHLVISVSFIVSAAFIAVVVLLAMHVYVNQAWHASRLQKDIDKYVDEFKAIDDIDTVLTVREQLLELPNLHSEKPAVTRLPDFLTTIVPNTVDIAEFSLDFTSITIRLSGKGEDVIAVNTFADVLKNTYFSAGDGGTPVKAFSDVEFSIGATTDEGVTFETSMHFDDNIFDINSDSVKLTVPNIISTQSALRSGALFDSQPVSEEETQ